MTVNLPITIGVAIIVIVLIIFLIRKNQQDKKKFEQEIIDSELPPEKDDKENL